MSAACCTSWASISAPRQHVPRWSSGCSRPCDGMRATEPIRPISVLVVDDHRLFADVLVARLQREPGVLAVTSAYSVDEAGVIAQRTAPDVVLLDSPPAGESGTGLIPTLQQLEDPPAVVMLSASEEPGDVIDSLGSGASGWVVKGSAVDVLMAAV